MCAGVVKARVLKYLVCGFLIDPIGGANVLFLLTRVKTGKFSGCFGGVAAETT
jgi:hypothetical protein